MEKRPWGEFHVLYDNDIKIKRIIVNPLQRLSLQSHQKRKEYWIVKTGKGKVQLDDAFIDISEGSTVTIDYLQKHRLINHQPDQKLELIEIQIGTYFGEDDIVRYQDDYYR